MKMEISKQDFEDAILVATSSHSEVFDSVKPHFLETYNLIKRSYLSDIGAKFFDETESFQPFLKRWVCLATFANVVRHLDLVLTPTGFGVVSNGEVTPASSARVENLIEQVSQAILAVVEECVCALAVNASGWGKTMQAKRCIPTLLWGYRNTSWRVRFPSSRHRTGMSPKTTYDWPMTSCDASSPMSRWMHSLTSVAQASHGRSRSRRQSVSFAPIWRFTAIRPPSGPTT